MIHNQSMLINCGDIFGGLFLIVNWNQCSCSSISVVNGIYDHNKMNIVYKDLNIL